MDFDDIPLCTVALAPSGRGRPDPPPTDTWWWTSSRTSARCSDSAGLYGEGSGVSVVGDPNQSIHAFAGANPKFLTRFAEDFRRQLVQLVRNYRSSHRC